MLRLLLVLEKTCFLLEELHNEWCLGPRAQAIDRNEATYLVGTSLTTDYYMVQQQAETFHFVSFFQAHFLVSYLVLLFLTLLSVSYAGPVLLQQQ